MKGPQPPNLPMGMGGMGGPGMKGPQPPNLPMGMGGMGAPGMKGPQPPNLPMGMGGMGGPGMKGPQPPNLAGFAGPGGGPVPPMMSFPPAPPAPPPSIDAAPSAKPQGASSTSQDEKGRVEIDDGFSGPQADTMVTGRFAVPRLPTNLGPVCTNLERILFLHCVPLFVDFEPEDLLVLARASEERGYPEGTVLFKQGDVGDEVFVIISGRVQLVYSETGGDRTATTLGPGDCIGEMSVIDGSLRSNTAVVTGVNTRVLAIAGDTFRRFVEERAHVSGKIIGVLANRLRQLTDRGEQALPKLSVSSADSMPAVLS
jgi:CRP-like cAMP-binding protein